VAQGAQAAVAVTNPTVDFREQGCVRDAAVEHRYPVAPFEGEPDERRADERAAADYQEPW
jgi:hypothetical protein